jgi:hypothetical protein
MKTKKEYEEYLNDLYVPDQAWEIGKYMYKKEIGYINKYGTKLRKCDPIAFNVGFNEWLF